MSLGQLADIEWAQPHSFHFLHRMARIEERLPQQVATGATQFGLVPRIGRMTRSRSRRAKQPQPRLRPVGHLRQRLWRRPSLELQPIHLRQARRDLENRIGKLAVAGEQDQPRRRIVQAPHRKHPARQAPQDVPQRGPAFRIGHRRNNVRRLIQDEVARLGGPLRQTPGDLHAVVLGIGLGAEFGDHHAVDAHLPAADQLFRMTPRSDSRPRNDFLQPFKHVYAFERNARL